MAEATKSKADSGKQVFDVSRPGKSAPSGTAKPVIVTNRPILQDPMVVTATAEPTGEPKSEAPAPPSTKSASKVIKPLEEAPAAPEPAVAEETPPTAPAKEAAAPPTKDDKTESEPAPAEVKPPESDVMSPNPNAEELAAEKQTEREEALQKLVDSRQYFLPINSVGKRKAQRFVALGVFLSLLLAVAWVDVALDAGLMRLPGVKPVTHFFSN